MPLFRPNCFQACKNIAKIETTNELQRQDSLFLLGSAKKVLRSLITIYVYPGIPMNIPQCQRKWFAGVLGSAGAGNPPGVFLASLHPLIGSIIKHNVIQNLGYHHVPISTKAQHLADPYSKLVSLNIVSSHWGNFRCWRPWPTGVTKAISPHHRGIVESTHHCLARCDHNTPGKFQKLLETWRLEWYRWLKPQKDTNGIFQKLNHSHPRGVPFLEGYVNSEPPQKVVWTPSTICVVSNSRVCNLGDSPRSLMSPNLSTSRL